MSKPESVSESMELDTLLRSTLTSQYHAALAMLRDAIELCPDSAWSSVGGGASFWRVAYHALYYTHLYLQADETTFTPWERHQTGLQDLDDIPGPEHLLKILELPHRPPQTGIPYSKKEMLEYWTLCNEMVDDAIRMLDLLAPETGFSWHTPSRPKMEQHLASIRHIQHHAAQLSDRVRTATGRRVDWVGTDR